jgi:hypothetical protein
MSRHPDGQSAQSTGQSADLMQRVLRVLSANHRDLKEPKVVWKKAGASRAKHLAASARSNSPDKKRVGFMRRLMNMFGA